MEIIMAAAWAIMNGMMYTVVLPIISIFQFFG